MRTTDTPKSQAYRKQSDCPSAANRCCAQSFAMQVVGALQNRQRSNCEPHTNMSVDSTAVHSKLVAESFVVLDRR